MLLRGRWWLPPSSSCVESYESMNACGSFMHQKCSNYALTNLLFGFCRWIWIIDTLVTCLNLHLGTLTLPFTPEMLQGKECAPIPSSVVFTLGLAFEFFKEFGGVLIILKTWISWYISKESNILKILFCFMANANIPWWYKYCI